QPAIQPTRERAAGLPAQTGVALQLDDAAGWIERVAVVTRALCDPEQPGGKVAGGARGSVHLCALGAREHAQVIMKQLGTVPGGKEVAVGGGQRRAQRLPDGGDGGGGGGGAQPMYAARGARQRGAKSNEKALRQSRSLLPENRGIHRHPGARQILAELGRVPGGSDAARAAAAPGLRL